MSLITRVPGDMWVRMMSKSVSLSLYSNGKSRLWFGGRCPRKDTVLRSIIIRTHLGMKFVVSTSMYCYNFLADTLLWLCSLHHCMHWSWSAKILHSLKKFMEDINWWRCICPAQLKRLEEIIKSPSLPFIHQGPTNAMDVFVCRATCVKHMNR